MNLIDRINCWLNYREIEESGLRSLIQNAVWKYDVEVTKIKDGYAIKQGSNTVWIKHWEFKWYIQESQFGLTLDYYDHGIQPLEDMEVKPSLFGHFVAEYKAFRHIKIDPSNPKYALLSTFGLLFSGPSNLLEFASKSGLKTRVFYSKTGFPETPKTFISKYLKGFYK